MVALGRSRQDLDSAVDLLLLVRSFHRYRTSFWLLFIARPLFALIITLPSKPTSWENARGGVFMQAMCLARHLYLSCLHSTATAVCTKTTAVYYLGKNEKRREKNV